MNGGEGRVKQGERPPKSSAAAASKEYKGPEMGNGTKVGEKGIVLKTFLTDWKKKKSRTDFIGRKGKEQLKTKIF